MTLITGFAQPACTYEYGYHRTSGSVAAGVIAGWVGGVLLGSAIASPPVYGAPPQMYGPPVPVYAPPVYYAEPRCYWRNVQE